MIPEAHTAEHKLLEVATEQVVMYQSEKSSVLEKEL